MQPLPQAFDAHLLDDIVCEGHHEQHAGFGFGYSSRTHVEKGVRVELAGRCAVAALHVVGIDFELRLGIDVGLLGGAEVAVGLYGRGLLGALPHENAAVEDPRGRVFEYIFEELVAGAVGGFVVDEGEVVDGLPLVGHRHAVEMRLGAFSFECDGEVVARVAIVQGDAVDQHVR